MSCTISSCYTHEGIYHDIICKNVLPLDNPCPYKDSLVYNPFEFTTNITFITLQFRNYHTKSRFNPFINKHPSLMYFAIPINNQEHSLTNMYSGMVYFTISFNSIQILKSK